MSATVPVSPATAEKRWGDYLVTGKLGSGGMGDVFAAVHTGTGKRRALKTPRSRDPVVVEQLLREIEALRQLRHPYIVGIHDHGVHEGQFWYAMDLLEGPTLAEVLRSPTNATRPQVRTQIPGAAPPGDSPTEMHRGAHATLQQLSRGNLLELCQQILEAVEYLHRAGVVHGDLKPDNVFILSGPRVVLADFGLAQSLAAQREALTLMPRGLGSVAYTAPECIRGRLADTRADLYSVGCILYECVVGTNPFLRATPEATALAQLAGQFVAPATLEPALSRRLDALIVRLLSKEPLDRPGYANEVGALLSSETGLAETRAGVGRLYRSALLGRDAALSTLVDDLRTASAGVGVDRAICGESGCGKTRLAMELANAAQCNDFVVVSIECAGASPHAPSLDLLRAIGERLPFNLGSSDVKASATAALRAAAQSPVECVSAFGDLARELVAYATTVPLLILIDDFDQADEATTRIVESLAAREKNGSRMVLVCAASAPTSIDGAFRELRLSLLSYDEVHAATSSILSEDRPPARLVAWAHEESGGNPLLLVRCLRALVESATLERDAVEGWRLRGDLPSHSQTSLETSRLVVRLDRLSEVEREIAGIAALLGRDFSIQTLGEVVGRISHDLGATLSALERRQVFTRRQDRFQFRHIQQGEFLRTSHSEETVRRYVHAIQALVTRPAPADPALTEALAEHRERLGNPSLAATLFVQAAAGYVSQQELDRARGAFRASLAALERAPDDASSARASGAQEGLGDIELAQRRHDEARASYQAALAGAVDDLQRARLFRKVATTYERDHASALLWVQRAVTLLGEAARNDETRRAEWLQVRLDAMFLHYWRQETDDLMRVASEVRETVLETGSSLQLANYHFNLAAGLLQRHRYRSGEEELRHVDRALELFLELDQHVKVSMSRFLRSLVLLCAERFDEAEAGFESLLGWGEKTASVTIQLRSLTYLSLIHRCRGALERVRRYARSMLALADEHRMPEYRGTALANLAWVALLDGEHDRCQQLALAATEAWATSSIRYSFCWTALLPLLAVALERPDTNKAADVVAIAARLLEPTQQCPSPQLRTPLEALTTSTESTASRQALTEVVSVARLVGWL